MKQKIKAYLIDPSERSITSVTVEQDNIDEIRSLLDCQWFTTGCYLRTGDVVYVNDEGLLGGGPLTFFSIPQGNSSPLAGKGLVLGTEMSSGKSVDAKVTAEDLADAVDWLDFKYDSAPSWTVVEKEVEA